MKESGRASKITSSNFPHRHMLHERMYTNDQVRFVVFESLGKTSSDDSRVTLRTRKTSDTNVPPQS